MKTKLILCLILLSTSIPSFSQSEPFIGEIKWVPYNFAPRGWALCDGQVLPIVNNQALFSLLGTTYGGDGRTTFALPDMRGRVMVHEGTGAGLQQYKLGERGGLENVSLTEQQIPSHSHALNGTTDTATEKTPTNNHLASKERTNLYAATATGTAPLNSASISNTGGSQPHENRQPYLTLNCIISLTGLFPSRS